MTTIQRYGNTRGLEGLPTISQFVVHDGVVHLLGVTGDPGGDVRTQTRDVLARIDKLLLRAGTDRSQLLTAQVWLRTMEDFDAHNEEWNAWVDSDEPPVRVCVQAELWQPELLVEIMVTAAVGGRDT